MQMESNSDYRVVALDRYVMYSKRVMLLVLIFLTSIGTTGAKGGTATALTVLEWFTTFTPNIVYH